MPKMGDQEFFDVGTSGPSRNFVYDMETYRYFVRDEWEEVLAHDADGRVTAGSFDALEAAQIAGREIKVGIRDLGADLAPPGADASPTRSFTLVGSGFLHVRAGLYVTLTHPLVRVAPRIPLRYASGTGTSPGSSCAPTVRRTSAGSIRTRGSGRTARRASPAAGSRGEGAHGLSHARASAATISGQDRSRSSGGAEG